MTPPARPHTPAERILVALDTPDLGKALALARSLKGCVGGVKLGLEFFSAAGPAGAAAVIAEGLPVFLDLKFHDIPNTVAGAVRAALLLKPFMLNVHAGGGPSMMRAAAEAARQAPGARPLVLGVTVLTSLDGADLAAVGVAAAPEAQVLRLARLAQAAGLDGVVCSPQEVAALRGVLGRDFALVVPGIRPAGSASDDQKRTLTPAQAVRAGADWLVIGRPITGAADPAAAARAIAAEIAGG